MVRQLFAKQRVIELSVCRFESYYLRSKVMRMGVRNYQQFEGSDGVSEPSPSCEMLGL